MVLSFNMFLHRGMGELEKTAVVKIDIYQMEIN